MKKHYFLAVLLFAFVAFINISAFSQDMEPVPNPVTPDKVINVEDMIPKPHLAKSESDVSGNNSPEAVNLYTPSYTSGITYVPLTGASTVSSWRGPSGDLDDNFSNNMPIGFTFTYNGGVSQYFRVSCNGFVTFNTTTNQIGNDGLAYSYVNTQFSTATTTTTGGTSNTLAPIYDDLAASALTNIVYKTTGAPGSRVCTIEWINMKYSGDVSPDLNFQVKLYESDGHIEFVYGTMTPGASVYSYTCGINAATVSASPTAAQLLNQTVDNTATFSATVQNALAIVPATNSMITFTPTSTPLPAPSGLNFTNVKNAQVTLNWTDNSTGEFSFAIFQSTNGGTTYEFIGTAAANSVTATLQGLTQSTNYAYTVGAVVENGISLSAPANVSTGVSPISGAYTINPLSPITATNFQTFLQCDTTLIYNGISGPVTVTVSGGTYNEFVTLTKISGTSATNTITFTGPVTGTRVVVNATGTVATNDYGIGLIGTDWTTFNNIDVTDAGTSSANQTEYGYYLQSYNFLDGAQHNTIQNANILLGGGGTVPGFSHGILQSTIASAREANSYNKYLNNKIDRSDRGIGIFGLTSPSLPTELDIEVSGNILGQSSALGDNLATGGSAIGIITSNCENLKFNNNTLVSLRVTNASNAQGVIGMSGQNCNGNIYNNIVKEVFNANATATGAAVEGIRIGANSAGTGILRLYNNFVSGVSRPVTTATSTTLTCWGIRIVNFVGGYGTSQAYYNSIYLSAASSVNYSSIALHNSTASLIANSLVDNICYNNVSSANRSIAIGEANTATTITSNYNNLYAPGTGGNIGIRSTTLFATLAAWQSGTGLDMNSSNVLVNFANVGTGDLHLSGASIGDINLLGTPIGGITTDIDGNTRGTVKPYKGADEVSGLSGLTLKLKWESCLNPNSVTVLLRNSTSPYAIVESVNGSAGGNVSSVIGFGNAVDGVPYYVVVKSANSVETWSAAPVTFSSHAASYDFTTALSQAYGNNQILSGGIPSIYQGDANQDGQVDGTDVVLTYNDASNFLTSSSTDYNCDGTTDLTDILVAFGNAKNFVGIQRP